MVCFSCLAFFIYILTFQKIYDILYIDMDGYPSGSRGPPAKGLGGLKTVRGFESLPVRHFYLHVIRPDEEAVLKTVGVNSLWGFESLCVRHMLV